MAPYDSDSSDDEESDYTVTNVLLGYTAEEAKDDTISHLGGRPTWLDPSKPPSAALAKCKVCDNFMVLLLQLNGELPDFPGHERRLYVWTCRQKACRRKEGSVRVLRGINILEPAKDTKKEKDTPKQEAKAAAPAAHIGETLFGANPSSKSSSQNTFSTKASSSTPHNPFSTSSTAAPKNPFAAAGLPTSELAAKPPQQPTSDLPKSFASALSLNSDKPKFGPPPPPEPWPQDSDLPAPYQLYFLDPDYEELDKVEEVAIPTQTIDLDEVGGSSGNQKEDKDIYESTIDKTFQKFADRLAQNPEQVLRYEFMGQPLLYSKNDSVGKLLAPSSSKDNAKVTTSSGSGNRIPRCTNCGAGRVFEVQMTPHAIMELERDELGLDGMEWGTIIVGVCSNDCQQKGVESGAGHVEEWAGVQWEELGEKRL